MPGRRVGSGFDTHHPMDGQPIHDVFRKLDNETVLGVMDLKDMPQPFFFVLRREGA